MTEVLDRSTKQAEQTRRQGQHRGLPGRHAPRHPAARAEGEEGGRRQAGQPPGRPLVWTNAGSRLLHRQQRRRRQGPDLPRRRPQHRLAGHVESFAKTQAKIGADDAQILWFLDIAKVIKIVTKANAKGGEAQAQQVEFLINELGINGLKSVGGTPHAERRQLQQPDQDLLPGPQPVQGLLKVFSLPPVNLRPEPWVPATVASYQSLSWDLDNAYNAINDLVNKFQPGMLNVLEQQLVGPEGGQPLSFQKDIFGPLGDRITMISDFKKPIKEDSQRMLVGVALEDAKAFQNTLEPDHRAGRRRAQEARVPGDDDLRLRGPVPNLPNNPGGGNVQATSRARSAWRSPRTRSS